jgi:hypothetical protein
MSTYCLEEDRPDEEVLKLSDLFAERGKKHHSFNVSSHSYASLSLCRRQFGVNALAHYLAYNLGRQFV